MMSSVTTGSKQAGQFQKGQSGNPSGRPRGARNSATLAAEALLDGEAEALTRKAIQMALAGDPVALRLCMERILPVRKDRPVSFALPPITSAREAADIMAAVAEAVAAGHMTPGEAAQYAKVVDAYVKAYQVAEFEDRAKPAERLTTAELMRIAASGRDEPDRAPEVLLLNPR
jgi:hypothetical protein